MRVLAWNVVLSTWLLVSAFILPHTPTSLAVTVIAAVSTSLLAALAARWPPVRYGNAAIACVLAGMALLGGMPGASAINATVVAAVLVALSLVSPLHAAPHQEATPEKAG